MKSQVAQRQLFTLLAAVIFTLSINGTQAFYSSASSSVTMEPPAAAATNQQATGELPLLSRSAPLMEQTVSHKSPSNSRQFGDTLSDVQIQCNSDNIVVTITTAHGFNGMIYPKGLSKNSTCMTEYHQLTPNITYYLPLKSCNTMSSDVEDGVEYFNTVMVQPHRRLVTNQGRGYHIRCRYQTKERTITNHEQKLSVNLTQSTPAVIGSAAMPACSMKIYSANDLSHEVAAENVRIGDELHLVISLEDQDVYGMLVTNCLVRDGMNWGEQPLLDDYGCPVDEEIMPQFHYAANLTRASVTFQAHKFPYTSSVYYQCNVRLCFREGGCQHVPPNCEGDRKFQRNYKQVDGSNDIHGRHKRWIDGGELDATGELVKPEPKSMNIEVISGLNVDESSPVGSEVGAADNSRDPMMAASTAEDPERENADGSGEKSSKNQQSEKDFCMSLRKFAIAISLASLLLMAAIIAMIACMIHKRKRDRIESERNTASVYNSHNMPYSNRAYCRE